MPEPAWIRDDVVLSIHRRQLAKHGGLEGIRDPGLLASALARPRNLLAYSESPPDLAAPAAAYAFGIAKNHPFLDGNKRTAFVVCRTFLLILTRPSLSKIIAHLGENDNLSPGCPSSAGWPGA